MGMFLNVNIRSSTLSEKKNADHILVKPPTSHLNNDGHNGDANPPRIKVVQESVEAREEQTGLGGSDDLPVPKNWSMTRKFITVIAICAISFSTSFSSSVFAPAVAVAALDLGVKTQVMNLGVSLYVLGFVAGSLRLMMGDFDLC